MDKVNEPAPVTIFERIGGEPAVSAVVEVFYRRVIADPHLSYYFANVDMGTLKAHQRSFVGHALGAPDPYAGRSMRAAHRGLAINGDDFDRVAGHLAASLAQNAVDEETIGQIATALAPLRTDIVTV